MNLVWKNFRILVEDDENELPLIMANKLKVPQESISGLQILRRSVDARKKASLYFVYTLQFDLELPYKEIRRVLHRNTDIKQVQVERPRIIAKPNKKLSYRPIVVGSGPAGYFAAINLSRHGYCPVVLERGDDVNTRTNKVEGFWQTGCLDPDSNVQFGEGGAGTFSDGKLTTRISDSRIKDVLKTFVDHGAPSEILFLAKPHIGTDILKKVLVGMRQEIIKHGGEVRFRSKVTGLKQNAGKITGVIVNHSEEIPTEAVILAIGHSSRDTYEFLHKQGLELMPKAFAIGLRVEHPQNMINLSQYGVEEYVKLGPADYQLTYQDKPTGRGAYAFCMCPGGKVVAATSEEERVVTNGMSNYRRDTGIANSALVVTVGLKDFNDNTPLAGIEFQRYWEHQAFLAGGKDYYAPSQTVKDFLEGRVTERFELLSSYTPGIRSVDLQSVLPNEVGEVLKRAILSYDQKIKGFAGDKATLTGIETRTSAPVRITRNELGESVNLKGLFPAGEGAGYAGGIVSAAVDGIRIAESIRAQYLPVDN